MTGLLLESKLDDDQRECTETIRTSSEALITIINDILDFSKIDAGELELELQHFSIEQCVAEAAELMASLAHEKGLELTYAIDAAHKKTELKEMTAADKRYLFHSLLLCATLVDLDIFIHLWR